jgi:hypothetical protein
MESEKPSPPIDNRYHGKDLRTINFDDPAERAYWLKL